MQDQFDVVVLAGYQEGKPDLLARAIGSPRKALVPLAGKPMIWHTIQALSHSDCVRDIVIVGIRPDEGIDVGAPVIFEPNHNGLLDNVYAGIDIVHQRHPDAAMVLLCSADIPLLTPGIVSWFVETCLRTEDDIYYSVVERNVMDKQFPDSKRSFIPFREGSYCGGDLFMVRIAAAHRSEHRVRDALARRKSAWRQARLLGVGTLIKFVFRRLSLAEAERVAGRVFDARGRVVVSPYAAIGMDVDKPQQYDMVRNVMERQPAGTGA